MSRRNACNNVELPRSKKLPRVPCSGSLIPSWGTAVWHPEPVACIAWDVIGGAPPWLFRFSPEACDAVTAAVANASQKRLTFALAEAREASSGGGGK